jgi:tetratricopeptide (TPR) repeat protein
VQVDGTLAGVTTMALKDAQSINFAIPVSAVRTFLKPREWNEDGIRHLADGGSMLWHEDHAFFYLHATSDAERHAVKLLEEAWQKTKTKKTEDYSSAIALANQAEQELPGEFKYLAHYITGRSHGALASISAVRSWNASRETLENALARYRDSHHAKAAFRHLVQASQLKSDFAPTYSCLASHHMQSREFVNALHDANSLIKLMQRCTTAFMQRASCYRELNQPELAISDLRAAVDLSPRDGSLHYQIATILDDVGEANDAIQSYEVAIALGFQNQFVEYKLGLAYRRVGNTDKAIKAFTKAKKMGWSAIICDEEIAECKQ